MESEQATPHRFNKECSLKFFVGSQVRQVPKEGRRTYRPKRWNNNKDEDNSFKTFNDNEYFMFIPFVSCD